MKRISLFISLLEIKDLVKLLRDHSKFWAFLDVSVEFQQNQAFNIKSSKSNEKSFSNFM